MGVVSSSCESPAFFGFFLKSHLMGIKERFWLLLDLKANGVFLAVLFKFSLTKVAGLYGLGLGEFPHFPYIKILNGFFPVRVQVLFSRVDGVQKGRCAGQGKEEARNYGSQKEEIHSHDIFALGGS